jgi:hypothetical protein
MMTRQQYLLMCLAEELGELQKEIFKCIRFGPETREKEGYITNIERANNEFNDVVALMNMLNDESGILFKTTATAVHNKISRVNHYYKLSQQFGEVK